MKLLLALITTAAALHAQGPQPSPDATRITSLIAAMNKALAMPDVGTLTALFSSEGDLRMADSVLAGPRVIAERLASRQTWSEVTPPRIENASVRLVTPDMAIVDASWVQHGSMIVRRAQPVLLLLKKQGGQWRVASLRLAPWCFADIPCQDCVVHAGRPNEPNDQLRPRLGSR